jgi:hypothetical protein
MGNARPPSALRTAEALRDTGLDRYTFQGVVKALAVSSTTDVSHRGGLAPRLYDQTDIAHLATMIKGCRAVGFRRWWDENVAQPGVGEGRHE